MKIVIICLLVALMAAAVTYGMSRSARIDSAPVSSFDFGRYLGTWYEIARYDNRFERGLQEVRAEYRLLAPGRIEVVNSGADASGRRREAVGRARPGRRPGQLRVSFFWIFYSDYNVLALGDDYGWALVGGGSPKYLWILSRTPSLPQETLERILKLASDRGYDTDRLLFVDQTR